GLGTRTLVEPLCAVPLNNELQQARALVAKAEVDVLLEITHKILMCWSALVTNIERMHKAIKDVSDARVPSFTPYWFLKPDSRDKICFYCSGSGTGTLVEPLSAVSLNDELQQARATIAKAEADVMLEITHKMQIHLDVDICSYMKCSEKITKKLFKSGRLVAYFTAAHNDVVGYLIVKCEFNVAKRIMCSLGFSPQLPKVGEGNRDHACWERHEDMDTPRTVIEIITNSPGTEVAADSAATLAVSNDVFGEVASPPTSRSSSPGEAPSEMLEEDSKFVPLNPDDSSFGPPIQKFLIELEAESLELRFSYVLYSLCILHSHDLPKLVKSYFDWLQEAILKLELWNSVENLLSLCVRMPMLMKLLIWPMPLCSTIRDNVVELDHEHLYMNVFMMSSLRKQRHVLLTMWSVILSGKVLNKVPSLVWIWRIHGNGYGVLVKVKKVMRGYSIGVEALIDIRQVIKVDAELESRFWFCTSNTAYPKYGYGVVKVKVKKVMRGYSIGVEALVYIRQVIKVKRKDTSCVICYNKFGLAQALGPYLDRAGPIFCEPKSEEGSKRQKEERVDERLLEKIDISFALTIDVISRQRWMTGNSKAIICLGIAKVSFFGVRTCQASRSTLIVCGGVVKLSYPVCVCVDGETKKEREKAITGDNFELKHGLLTLVQNKKFFGHDKEDPHAHIRYFNKITSTLNFPNVPNMSIKLMLFPFFLEDQDSLNFAAGGNFLDKMPRECLAIIESKSKVRYSRDKPVVFKVSTNASTSGVSPDVAELKNMVKALLLDKKEFVSQASGVNYNQRNTSYRPPMMYNQIRPPGFPPVPNNQNVQKKNQNRLIPNQNRGNNFNQGPIYQPSVFQPPAYQAPAYQAPAPQTQGVSKEDFSAYVKANDAVMKNMQTQGQNMQNQLTNLTDLITKFVNSNTASTLSSGTLSRNTITNPKSDLKEITTRSGVSYDGPEATKNTVNPTNNGNTEDVQPQAVQFESLVSTSKPVTSPIAERVIASVSASKPNPKASIIYPSRRNDERNREKANNQIKKFYQIFKDMSFEISFANALILMPKFASTLKALIRYKEKLSEMARTPLNENYSAVLLKKLPKKLGDPCKFLIPCDFPCMAECLALADLGASVNLMPFSVWKRLYFLDLTPTCMTLELADRSISHPVGVAEDVYVKEVLGFSDTISSGSPTPYYDPVVFATSPILTLFENSDFLLEEVDAFLAVKDEPTSSEFHQPYLDPEGDILLLEAFLNDYPSLPPLNQRNYLPKVRKELKICEAKSDKSSVDEPQRKPHSPTHTKRLLIVACLLGYAMLQARFREMMLKRCEDTNLCLNWENSHFMVKEGIVLGHKISKQGIEVDKAKVDVISKLPHPTSVKAAGLARSLFLKFIPTAPSISHNPTGQTSKSMVIILSTILERTYLSRIPENVKTHTKGFCLLIFISSASIGNPYLDPDVDILLLEAFLNDDPSLPPINQGNYMAEVRKELKICEAKSDKYSVDEPPEVELKDLPPHLEYAFLESDDKLPVIIAKDLCMEEKTALITVLKSHKRAIAWKFSYIKVSPAHCVPKKGGSTVVENEDNELIPTSLVTGWHVCIDYCRLHYVLCRLWFIFHHLRKKRSQRWNLRLKNPPLKHLVFEEPELGKLEVGKPGVDKQEREENQEVKFDLISSEDDNWDRWRLMIFDDEEFKVKEIALKRRLSVPEELDKRGINYDLVLCPRDGFVCLYQSCGSYYGCKDAGTHVVRDEGVNIVVDEEVEATVADKPKGSKKKRKAAGGASGSNLSPKKLREDHGTSSAGVSICGKSVDVLQDLLECSTLAVEVGVIRSLVSDPPIMTMDVAITFVAGTSSVLVPRAAMSRFMQDMDSKALRQIYVPKWNVVNESALDDPDFNVGAARQICLSAEIRMRIEHILRVKKKLEGRCTSQADLLKERDAEIVNLKAQLSLREAEAAEAIRLRGEKSTLEGQVAALEFVVFAKEAECASLFAQTAKLTQDLSDLQLSFDELNVKVASLESQKDNLASQVKILSDKVAGLDAELMGMALYLDEEFYPRFLTTIASRRWILSRGLRLIVMKYLQSPEYLVALGKAIGRAIDKGMQNGLEAGIDHGRAGRILANVAAYDPSTEVNYVSAMHALCNLGLPLLSQLKSQKDASITDIMSLLHLKGPVVKTPEASQLQPSYEQLLLPIHRKKDNVVIEETSLSFSLDVVHARVQRVKGDDVSRRLSLSDDMVPLIEPLCAENLVGETSTSGVPATAALTTTLSTTFAQIGSFPSILFSDYEVLDAKPQTEAPPSASIIFEKEELDTTP
nr:hypothetical protein [Tanacetum cinerariifolium]